MKLVSLFLSALIAVCPGPALAEVTAHASLSILKITLTDLDPNDGIAPALSDSPPTPFNEPLWMGYQLGPGSNIFEVEHNIAGTTPWGPLSVEHSYTGANPADGIALHVSSHVTGSSLDTISMVADSSAIATGSAARSAVYARARTFALTLSPMTSMTVTAELAMHSSLGPPSIASGSAHSSSSLYFYSGWGEPDFISSNYLSHTVGWLPPNEPDIDGEREISFTWANTLTRETHGSLQMAVNAVSYAGPPPPVPEPSTWAMLLGGAAVVAIRQCRSRGAGRRGEPKRAATAMRQVSTRT